MPAALLNTRPGVQAGRFAVLKIKEEEKEWRLKQQQNLI
jgi:hypothetical protein